MLKSDILSKCFELTVKKSSRWYNIGLKLKIHEDVLKNISSTYNDPVDQYREVLSNWLRRNVLQEYQDTDATWDELIEAIASPAGGNDRALLMSFN